MVTLLTLIILFVFLVDTGAGKPRGAASGKRWGAQQGSPKGKIRSIQFLTFADACFRAKVNNRL
jgi:hypothetical protein